MPFRSKCNKYDYIAVKTMQWYSAIITAANTYIIRTTFEKYKPSLYKHLLTCQMDNPTQEQNKNIHTHIFVGLPPWTYVFFLAAAVCCSCNANCIEGSRPEVAQILLERLFHGDDPMSIFKAERFTDTESSILTRLSLKDVRLVLDAAERTPEVWPSCFGGLSRYLLGWHFYSMARQA